MRGTFEVFEAAAAAGIGKVIFISTTSVYRPNTRYGSSKILAEQIAEDYRKNRLNMNVVTLRPRGFIPYWDRAVYANTATGRAGSGRARYRSWPVCVTFLKAMLDAKSRPRGRTGVRVLGSDLAALTCCGGRTVLLTALQIVMTVASLASASGAADNAGTQQEAGEW